ncbi:hypothetical protein LPJ64_004934 [Coemansia asiatica]|uniref:Metallo-dependent phosphatase n=1 Tax=Coemansia asiatica TaxID=1052880 RepID=A0A9W7XI36_9FUNG|nr:hypothetical protein LPJ64_004934 [Coemansia asiatica]
MSQDKKLLRILHFNDVYHVASSEREPVGGAARFASIIHMLQQDTSKAPALTLFSGDAYFPSLESSISRGEHMLPVLNTLNIDASTFGNHEFDQGIDRLEDLIKRNNFSWIVTNLTDKKTGGPAAQNSIKYLVKCVDGLRIGIIGIIEKEWLDTLPCMPPTFVYHEFVKAAREAAVKLRCREDPLMSCDLVICLSHMRLPNDIKLADACADVIDLVLSGHDHFYYIGSGVDEFSDPDGSWVKPLAAAEASEDDAMLDTWKKERDALPPGSPGRRLIKSGTDFRDLSEITLEISSSNGSDKAEISRMLVTRHRTTTKAPENPEVKIMVDKIESHLSKALDKDIGFTTVAWDARSTVCRTQESNIGSFSADLMRLGYAQSAGVQIGFLCGGAIRSDSIYPEGPIRLREIMNIFPFEDPVVVIKLTGDQIRRALENGVSKWPAHEGRFPQVSGIRFEFDPSREPGSRVTSIVITASAKAAATQKSASTSSDSLASLPRVRPSVSAKSANSMHRIALENNVATSNASSTSLHAHRASNASSIAESESDVESDYGAEEDEPLDMAAEYVVATRDYMYQGHDGYEVLNEGELIVDEENGITFADLYRRFFRGLAVKNAFRFKKQGFAGSCSLARNESVIERQEKQKLSGKSQWKLLIIKHAANLKELAQQREQELQKQQELEEQDSGRSVAARIASIVQQYHESLANKAQLLTHHSSNIVRALLSSAKRLSPDQDPMRVARTALFGADDNSSLPLSDPDTPQPESENVPRNDDADGLMPELLINRKDTRSYASEELLARWAVVSPQTDGRIKIANKDST